MPKATNYPGISIWDGYNRPKQDVPIYDSIPALMQLMLDLGYYVDNRVDFTKFHQKFVFVDGNNRHSYYCAIKDGDQVLIDSAHKTHYLRENVNWIDLKSPNSIELIKSRIRKVAAKCKTLN